VLLRRKKRNLCAEPPSLLREERETSAQSLLVSLRKERETSAQSLLASLRINVKDRPRTLREA